MKYNIIYENERVQLTGTWSEMCDLFIEARETIDGYEVFIITEDYSRQLDFGECVSMYPEGIVESFMENYWDYFKSMILKFACDIPLIYVGDEDIANLLEFDMEESLEEDRANEVDEPDPDAEYDRMKDEGELKR